MTLARLLRAIGAAILLVAASAPAYAGVLVCDDTLKHAFRPDALTTVLLVHQFKAGDTLTLGPPKPGGGGGMVLAGGPPARAKSDLCLVKVLVGPGNPGPAYAPSTSPGIGMEIWLPSKADWNQRIHNMGGGGWVGGDGAAADTINWPYVIDKADIEHAVTSMQDTGHQIGNGSFAMLPDGKPNLRLWEDFAVRGLHVQAVITKALTRAYYGRPQKYAYFEGGSTGGRQAHKLAQAYPEDYDGIVGLYPAFNWSRWAISTAHKALVFERDLGGKPLTEGQQDLVSLAAIRACDVVGGKHLGYIMDNASCRYDPVKDPEVLCSSEGGRNSSTDCVTRVQAAVFNKIWYGPTTDGTAPDPAVDNGYGAQLRGKQLWFGVPRGTLLTGSWYVRNLMLTLGNTQPAAAAALRKMMGGDGQPASGSFGADQLALLLQDPKLADPTFMNASGVGQGLWRKLTPEQVARAFARSAAMDPTFWYIDTDNPDLSAFKARGGKFVGWHGTADETIPVQGTMNYYSRLVRKMGGAGDVDSFYRMYIVPGAGHGASIGVANGDANPPAVENQMYELVRAWVENGIAPGRVELRSGKPGPMAAVQPICALPKTVYYTAGNPLLASSFTCK